MSLRLTLALVPALLMAGCAGSGRTVTTSELQNLQVGVTTQSAVEHRFGKPVEDNIDPSGGTILSYHFAQSEAPAEGVMPMVDHLLGGPDTDQRVVALVFDSAGLFRSYWQ